MNYLAHALLSPEDPLVLMGNLWGDLLKPKDYELLLPEIRSGVERHKKIDAFTDQHTAVDQMVKLLRPYQGKYTPVVADVLMDYMLSKYWNRYHEQSIEAFCQTKYATVHAHLEFMPERLHPRINRMLEHRWLESCKNRDRMDRTLLMLSRRAVFENAIPEAMLPYDVHESDMDALFIQFFEDIQRYIILQNAG
jgi:acyl carrier protein phosphodiesterase